MTATYKRKDAFRPESEQGASAETRLLRVQWVKALAETGAAKDAQRTIQVLVVEPDFKFARTMRESLASLTSSRFELFLTGTIKEALDHLDKNRYDAILLDLSLPDCHGLNTFEQVYARAPTAPIIILADFDNETVALQAVREGAQDYLVKGKFDGRMLSRVIRYAIERKRIEEALRESERRYRRLLESTTDYIYTVKVQEGRSIDVSHGPGCIAVTGYSPADYTADPHLWYRMVHNCDREAVSAQIDKVLAGDAPPPIEHRIIHRDGSIRWIKNTPVPRKDEFGNVVSYDGLISDISRRKRAEHRLATQYAIASVLAEATALADAAPKILQATCESLGWETGALWQVDPQHQVLRSIAVWQRPERLYPEFEAASRQMTFAREVGLPGRIWASGEPTWIVNVTEDANFPRAPVAVREGLHGAFGFPVKIGQQVLGVIEFFSRQIEQPDEDLLRMMATIGGQIGQFMVRKQAEEALAEERNLLRTLIDTLPDAIYVKDTRSRFVLGNVGVAHLMGAAKAEDVYGKTDFEFFPADLARQYFADELAVVQSGQPLINREEPVIDSDGNRRWLLTTKAPLRDIRSTIIGLVGMGRDITERKQVEELQRMSEARLQAILDNTTAVIYLKDIQGKYLLVNNRFESLFHVTREQVVNKSDYDLFPKEMAEAFRANDQKVLEGRTPFEFEEIAPHDGELQTYISIKFPLCDASGLPYALCGISTDITERKRAETKLLQANFELLQMNEELSRSEDALRTALADLNKSHHDLKAAQLQLIHAAKMESIGTLAAGVAHEVKNPLQTILMGLAYLTNNTPAKNESINLVLADMRDAVSRADAIVRGLLHFAAADQLDIKAEDPNGVVSRSLGLVNFQIIGAGVAVQRELAPDLPPVRLDKSKMEQVFINLFMNAIQAMPSRGTLTVRTSARYTPALHPGAGAATQHGQTSEAVVVAEVFDTGSGIPPEKLPRIFDPFYTTKPNGVGTGLGLPVTKKIIELHGGTIDIRNRPEGGVHVTVTLKAVPVET